MARTFDPVRAANLLTLIVAAYFVVLLIGSGKPHDAISYWASGRLLLHHQNPYDALLVGPLEYANGFGRDFGPLIMRNPPSALVMALPLGLFGLRAAALLWIVGSLAALIVSVRMSAGRMRMEIQLLGYTFGPAIFCIFAGQSALYALFGIVLFIRLHRTQPLWTGVALWFCLLKPHLLLPFVVAVVLWVIWTRNYRVFLGTGAALCLSTGVAMLFKADIWHNYQQLLATPDFSREFVPCLAVSLRDRTHLPWMQYVPAAMGMVFAAWFFWRHRAQWDWVRHGNILLLVSLVVAPYAWVTDHVIVLPALLFAIAETKRSYIPVLVAVANAAMVIAVATSPQFQLHSPAGISLALVWPCLYFLARRTTPGEVMTAQAADAV